MSEYDDFMKQHRKELDKAWRRQLNDAAIGSRLRREGAATCSNCNGKGGYYAVTQANGHQTHWTECGVCHGFGRRGAYR